MLNEKIIRQFLTNKLPLSIDKFESLIIKDAVIDETKRIECINDKYYLYDTVNEITSKHEISKNKFNFLIQYKSILLSSKTRYYVPLTTILTAEIVPIDNIINVQFNDLEEANNFEIPDWFGPEILINFGKSKKKVKIK